MMLNFKISNRLKAFFSLSIIFLFLILQYIFRFPCVFRETFGFFCPACGLTRSIESLLSFDFVSSFSYSIIGVPVLSLILFAVILLSKDFIQNSTSGQEFIFSFFKKFWLIFLVLLILSFFYNNHLYLCKF